MKKILQHLNNIYTIAKIEVISLLKEPVYYIILVFAFVLIFFSKDFTLFTLDWGAGDEPSYVRTMLREMGIATTLLAGLFLGLITASKSIYNEIIHKTVLITLSKPVSRNDFLLGKYFGIITGLIPMFLLLGMILVLTIWLQSGEDVRAGDIEHRIWDFHIFKGVYINFLQASVLIALSVAVSTRLPFLTNLLIVLSVFIAGHLLNFINGYFMKIEGWFFYVLQFLYAVCLNLENYNYFYRGETQHMPSASLIFFITAYSVIYAAIFLIIANVSFSKRDLF